MHQRLQAIPLLAALAMAGGWAAGSNADEPAKATTHVEAEVAAAATAGPEARAEAAQAVDGAVAASLIGAIAAHFGEQDVGVKLDRIALEPASIRDRTVTGQGRVRIGGREEWIPFRFHALYDIQTTQVLSPLLELGPDRTDFEAVADDSDVARALDTRVGQALGAEFPAQPVKWNTDHVRVAPLGDSLVRVQARGTADFDAEGLTDARVDALYDRATGEWISLEYELGASANLVEETPVPEAVATR